MGRVVIGPYRRPLLTRRTILRAGVSTGVGWMMSDRAARATPPAPDTVPTGWRTWLLTSADELRPAPPGSPASDELAEILALQRQRTAVTSATVNRWDDPSIVLPWTNLTLDLIKLHPLSPVRAGRALALLHVALYDTLRATWDARAAYPRQGPTALDQTIVPLGKTPVASSFPSEHAAVATAAATVLAYLFPDEPADGLSTLADEAATSRLVAGRNYRSDVVAGQAIGLSVGKRAVARGEADGSDAAWDGSGRLTGSGSWQPTPPGYFQQPLDPLAGTWQTWLLARG